MTSRVTVCFTGPCVLVLLAQLKPTILGPIAIAGFNCLSLYKSLPTDCLPFCVVTYFPLSVRSSTVLVSAPTVIKSRRHQLAAVLERGAVTAGA